ncbi:haloacid dehalogenase [Irpex rosettiformis]|uniref:Haloacid dehalogenase n=1 Tax=Irpex rosettiformis TaxID=378272 RepID=A0ACB8U8Q7_9APHY|nr:haloacid dehalogenase [Irpex rosettiformis]
MSVQKQVLAFDIYGTILDTGGIAKALQSHVGIDEEKAKQVSLLWRRYQLEYTWRLNAMELYEPFNVVTKNALMHALGEQRIRANDEAIDQLMNAYNTLTPFDDAIPALQALSKLSHVKVLIFSNGTREMVTSALNAASVSSLNDGLYLADDQEVKIYKPAKKIYQGLLAKVNEAREDGAGYTGEDVWLVSGNPFDVVGARNAGLQAFWVDRAGAGWLDRASPVKPSTIVRSLSDIVKIVGGER